MWKYFTIFIKTKNQTINISLFSIRYKKMNLVQSTLTQKPKTVSYQSNEILCTWTDKQKQQHNSNNNNMPECQFKSLYPNHIINMPEVAEERNKIITLSYPKGKQVKVRWAGLKLTGND